MAAGTFTYTPGQASLAQDAVPIGVYLYTAPVDTGNFLPPSPYTLLPNIRCEQIQYKEGSEVPSARFSYVLDDQAAANGWPNQFDEIWPVSGTSPSPYVVEMSDELVVLASLPDGSTPVLFHGFARVPQADISPAEQAVTFTAAGVAIRCWDVPIHVRPQRSGADPFVGPVVTVDGSWRFNPAGDGPGSVGGIIPNCTPDGFDVDQGGDYPYPVFAEPLVSTIAGTLHTGDGSTGAPVLWDLSRAARTILAFYNDEDEGSPITNPDFSDLETLLQNRRPLKGAEFFDPNDPSTYQTDDNVLRDYDCTNKAWPEVLSELLEFYGFAMRWTVDTDANGNPVDSLDIYRKDAGDTIAPKQIYLPPVDLDISQVTVNLGGFHAGFDFHGVANQIELDTHPRRYEASFLLAPAFIPTPGDGLAANKTQFLLSNLYSATPEIRDKYRVWHVDDLGEGFWAVGADSPSWVTTQPFDYSLILKPRDDGLPSYVARRRKPVGTLLSRDDQLRPYKAQLAISRAYKAVTNLILARQPPCIWDKPDAMNDSDVWQTVKPSTWELLPDRIGIRIICDDVDSWFVGAPPFGQATALNGDNALWPVSSGLLSGIRALANPLDFTYPPVSGDYTFERYYLRLTCVFDADMDLHVVAKRRDASPLADVVRRRVDTKDHFGFEAVTIYSALNDPAGKVNPPAPIIVRDDRKNAQAFADQMRTAHELPAMTASVTIPSLVGYLKVGDRLSLISGRNVSLQQNAGGEQQEAASYPYVVALTWDFQGSRQSTQIQMSDRRHEPARPRG